MTILMQQNTMQVIQQQAYQLSMDLKRVVLLYTHMKKVLMMKAQQCLIILNLVTLILQMAINLCLLQDLFPTLKIKRVRLM